MWSYCGQREREFASLQPVLVGSSVIAGREVGERLRTASDVLKHPRSLLIDKPNVAGQIDRDLHSAWVMQ